MDPNNPIPSNHDQFDVKPTYIKQMIDDDANRPVDFDMDLLLKNSVCGMARNGKHDEGEYDYADIGPETDVDAGENVHDNNYPSLVASSSLDPTPESEKSLMETEKHNDDDDDDDRNDNDYSNRENANVCPVDSVVNDNDVDNRVRPSDKDVRGADDETLRDNGDNDARIETAGTHTVLDDDESPPSPRAAKPLQHALIVADNVADSEDSEDEWDYYRVDPKQESAAIATNESRKDIEEQSPQENLESVAKDSSEIQSPEAENDIKCEEVKDTSSLKLINIDISDEKKSSESEKEQILLDLQEEKKEQDNMDFQLNPEAAEFVPLSPPLCNRGLLRDFAISGSPLKQTQTMDDIPVPSQSEFDKEVSHRPKEIGEDFSHDEHADLQNNSSQSLDVSEISSTKAEMGDDESMMHVMSTSQWQTDISSQWNEKTTRDEVGSDLEEGDVTKTNPMAMSLTPGNFEAAFEKNVDLNAVHMLDDSSDGAEQASTPPRSPEPAKVACDEERAHTPLSEDKNLIDVLCASTPQPPDDSVSTKSSEISVETKNEETSFLSTTMHEKESSFDSSNSSQEFLSPKSKKIFLNMPGIHMPGFEEDVDARIEFHRTIRKVVKGQMKNPSCIEHTLSTDDEEEKFCFKNDEDDEDDDDDMQALIMKSAQSSQNSSQVIEKENMESEVQKGIDSTDHSNFEAIDRAKQHILTPEFLATHCEIKLPPEQIYSDANIDPEIMPEKVNVIESPFTTETQSDQSTNWTDCYKTEEAMLQSQNSECNIVFEDSFCFEKKEIEKCDKNEDNTEGDDNIKPDSTTELNLSNSMQKSSFVEDVLQADQSEMSEKNVPMAFTIDAPTEQTEKKAAEFAPTNIEEIFKEKLKISGDIPPKQEETESRKDISLKQEEIESQKDISLKQEETESQKIVEASLEDTVTIDKLKEEVTEVAEVTVGAAIVATVAAAAIASPMKVKATTTTSAKRPTKTTTMKATTALTTKTATKSPTSPSKAISTTMRTTTTSSLATQSIAKKPATNTATRPKQLDGSTKAAVSSVSGKTTVTKTMAPKNTTTTATRSSVSPRVSSGATRPKTTTITTSSKVNSGSLIEKKSTVSGDTKSISKSATAKPASATLRTATTPTTAKTTLVKTSSTTAKTSTSNVMSKPRPASATSATKITSTTKQSITGVNGASRPRTAPTSGGTTKLRENTGKTITATSKSPLIDKQSKETVNKQISRSGVSTPKMSGRLSAPGHIGTAAGATKTGATRTSFGKSAGNASATSPTKKALTPKTASKTPTTTKRISSSEAKILQNGIPKENETKAAVITAPSKPEDDVPRKDASPVNVPTDNQLIAD